MILALLACVIFFGLAVGLGFRAFLAVSAELLERQLLLVGALFAVVFLVLAVFTWRYLRPVARLLHTLRESGVASSPEEDRARHAVLRFPQVVVQVALAVSALAIGCGVAIDLSVLALPPRLVAGMAIGSLSVAMVSSTFIYVLARSMILPIAAHFRQEQVPSGIRVSVRSKILLTTVALALASAVPTGVICARRIHVLRAEEEQQHARHLAEAVAYGGTVLGPAALRQSLASTRLPEASVRLNSLGGPTASPLPAGHIAPFVAVTLQRDTAPEHAILTFLVLATLVLSILVGSWLGRDLARDIALLASRIASIGAGARRDEPVDQPPGDAPSIFTANTIPQFSDLRTLASALNALLIRIAEIHVTQFVAIEKTLAADRVKMQFLANVSHDLRSPLNAILGFSELLLRETQGPLEERPRTAVQTIQRAGSELLHLIDEVLDLAKLEAGRITLHREDSMPALIVNEAVQEVRRIGQRDEVRIETELQAGLPMVWVDPHRLQQAIQHLLRFSLQNLRAGEISIRVRTEALAEPGRDGAKRMLLIRIADTGRGLEGDEVGQLFIGFRRKSGVRGLGLGVPLAKALVEMHGGTLQVYSTPGVGTTFAADLPVLQRKVLGRLRPVTV
jgi:signal transduction histidine kinase